MWEYAKGKEFSLVALMFKIHKNKGGLLAQKHKERNDFIEPKRRDRDSVALIHTQLSSLDGIM